MDFARLYQFEGLKSMTIHNKVPQDWPEPDIPPGPTDRLTPDRGVPNVFAGERLAQTILSLPSLRLSGHPHLVWARLILQLVPRRPSS